MYFLNLVEVNIKYIKMTRKEVIMPLKIEKKSSITN